MTKDFIKDLLRYIPSKVLPGIFGFLTIPIFTRLFSPNEYGQYIIVISTVSVLSILANDWIGNSIIRFYPKYQKKSEINVFNGTIIRITAASILVITITTFAILSIFKTLSRNELYLYVNIGLLLLASGIAFNVMMQMLVAKRMANQYSFFSIWRQCICILMGFFLVVTFKLGVDGMLLGIATGIFIILPIIFRLAFGNCPKNNYSKNIRMEFMQYGLPLVATNIAAWIIALSDRYIIEYFRGSQEVGLYSISYSLADGSIMLIVSLVVIASQPIVMKKWETEGAEETKAFIRDMTKFYLIITLPAAVGLGLLSEPIVKILVPKNYYYGYKIIPMVSASIFLFGLQRNFQLGLLFFKKTNVIMYLVIVAGLVNIATNFMLVPKYGFIAAGYTTLFSYSIFAALSIAFSRKYLAWKFPFITLAKVVIATVAMGFVVLLIQELGKASLLFTLIWSVIAGALVYFMLLIIMKELNYKLLIKILSFPT